MTTSRVSVTSARFSVGDVIRHRLFDYRGVVVDVDVSTQERGVDDDDVIEGQASVAVEIEAQLGRAPDLVVLPVGGGGLSSGGINHKASARCISILRAVTQRRRGCREHAVSEHDSQSIMLAR